LSRFYRWAVGGGVGGGSGGGSSDNLSEGGASDGEGGQKSIGRGASRKCALGAMWNSLFAPDPLDVTRATSFRTFPTAAARDVAAPVSERR